ncbi:MAG: AAA family ATPase [Chitinophagaceae bacterium]|nr:AAA family ATPase [Chitinophagaceae bacterium]
MFTKKLTFRMHISIKNLGIVKSAEIELKGITVITGYNDTGKSFISKLVFAIIKTITGAEKLEAMEKGKKIMFALDAITITYKRVIPQPTKPSKYDSKTLLDAMEQYVFVNSNKTKKEFYDVIDDYKREITEEIKMFTESKSRIRKKELVETVNSIDKNFNIIYSFLNDIRELESIYKNYFQSEIINNLFEGAINNIESNNELTITLTEGSSQLVYISISNNTILSFKYDPINTPLFNKDVHLIETPMIVSLERVFDLTNNFFFRNSEIPLQFEDLVEKIRVKNNTNNFPDAYKLIEEINKIIGGNSDFDTKSKSIFFTKENNKKISSSNIASGIKSFVLLEILLKNNYLTPNTVLIIDEPEVHLHPAWEIIYAELLFTFCKYGITILIATHSGYFLQAIAEYSTSFEMEDKVTFYFGEKIEEGVSDFKDVTSDLEPIFRALSKPMRDIFRKQNEQKSNNNFL